MKSIIVFLSVFVLSQTLLAADIMMVQGRVFLGGTSVTLKILTQR